MEDILYVKDEFPAGNSIHLQFKHLFSLLTLHLEGNLQTYFQKIEVTCPAVSSIIPKSAEIVLADNGTHTTTIAQVSPSGNYSFIVPPVGNMVIAINMVTNGKKYTTQLETKSFTGNKEYTYHLKISEKTSGNYDCRRIGLHSVNLSIAIHLPNTKEKHWTISEKR